MRGGILWRGDDGEYQATAPQMGDNRGIIRSSRHRGAAGDERGSAKNGGDIGGSVAAENVVGGAAQRGAQTIWHALWRNRAIWPLYLIKRHRAMVNTDV